MQLKYVLTQGMLSNQ